MGNDSCWKVSADQSASFGTKLEMYSQNQVPFKKNKKSAKECSNAEKTEMQGTKAETR